MLAIHPGRDRSPVNLISWARMDSDVDKALGRNPPTFLGGGLDLPKLALGIESFSQVRPMILVFLITSGQR